MFSSPAKSFYLCRMTLQFETLKTIIESRRTIKPEIMNGQKIPENIFHDILSLANWAPTHGRTEPWRFHVYTGTALKQLCTDHAEMYRKHTPEENFNPGTYENILHKGDLASHLVIAVMKKGTNPKIPVIEEIASASASVDNILLGATALGVASMWNTGGMAHKQPMKDYLNLAEEDLVLGFIYMGYTDEGPKEGKRMITLEEKIFYH
jgi:nitroreductase